MEKTTIKIMAFPTVDTILANPDEESLKASRLQSQEYKTHKIIASGWEFTGHLLEDLGNNIGFIANKEELALTDVNVKYAGLRDWIHQYMPDGIYPVEVSGVDTPCIGYFWAEVRLQPQFPRRNRVIQHGMVCYINDGDANAIARNQFAQRTTSL